LTSGPADVRSLFIGVEVLVKTHPSDPWSHLLLSHPVRSARLCIPTTP
jgi:hypothetical protein